MPAPTELRAQDGVVVVALGVEEADGLRGTVLPGAAAGVASMIFRRSRRQLNRSSRIIDDLPPVVTIPTMTFFRILIHVSFLNEHYLMIF